MFIRDIVKEVVVTAMFFGLLGGSFYGGTLMGKSLQKDQDNISTAHNDSLALVQQNYLLCKLNAKDYTEWNSKHPNYKHKHKKDN